MTLETSDPLDIVRPARRVSLSVSGMTCGACASRVERKLNKVDGVVASVNYATQIATIDAPPTLSTEDLCDVVVVAGYGAAEYVDRASMTTEPEEAHIRDLFRRLVVALILFVPLADLSVMFAVIPGTRFPLWEWALVVLAAPVVLWSAWPFHKSAWKNAKHRTATMETLISTGVIAASAWSVYAIFFRTSTSVEHNGVWAAITSSDSIYLEVAAGVTVFVLAGRYFEAKAKLKAGGALRALAALGAKDVCIITRDGDEFRIPVSELKEGQKFLARPGEVIAADGLVVQGSSTVDMSAMTGESIPVEVSEGGAVVGGTISLNGRLIVEAAAVGADTQLAGMIRLVEQAQTGKAQLQRLADRIAGVFVPTVFAISFATLLTWLLFGATVDKSVSAALAVLVIACPCALGLATPTALMVASGRGAQLGIFIKGYHALEATKSVDTVVFDKTGTVTNGTLTIADITVREGDDSTEFLRLVGAVEDASEHPVAIAIAAAARSGESGTLAAVTGFMALPGLGARGVVDDHVVEVGRARLFKDQGIAVPAELRSAQRAGESLGHTVVFASIDGRLQGAIAVSDTIKASAPAAIEQLQRLGLRTLMLTGDNAYAAQAIAEQVGIDEVIAEVMPDGKVDVVRRLQDQGYVVAMVGDGINDGPALATADLGLAIGAGTDVAIGAADIILVRDDLTAVSDALGLARATLRTIKGNMFWAFGYNVAAIPIAALGLLNPLIAGAAMAFSSFFVVSNSLRLRKFNG